MRIIKILVLGILLTLPGSLLAQVKVGTAGAQWLKLPVSARSAGMADAFLPLADDVTALYYNPGGLIQLEKPTVAASHLQLPVGTAMEWFGYANPMYRGRDVASVWGVYGTFLHTDMMDVTTPMQPDGNGQQFNYMDVTLGLAWTQRLTNKFAVGATIKYLQESTYEEYARGWSADVGTYYDTNWRSVRLAMIISNFGPDMEFVDGPYPLPISFRFGVGATPIDRDGHRMELSFQFGHPNDNVEEADVGVEYSFKEKFALRWGKRFNGIKRYSWDKHQENFDNDPYYEYPILDANGVPSLDGMSFGVGLKFAEFQFDLAYQPNKYLGSNSLITLSYQF